LTMKVIVINDDAEPTRKLVVETVEANVNGQEISVMDVAEIEAGKHKDFYVHSTAQLKVKEVEVKA